MTFVDLPRPIRGRGSKGHAVAIRVLRYGLKIKAMKCGIRMASDVLYQLNLSLGSRVSIQIGTGENYGAVRIFPSETGGKLSPTGPGSKTLEVFCSRIMPYPVLPTPFPTSACTYHITDGTLYVDIPKAILAGEGSDGVGK